MKMANKTAAVTTDVGMGKLAGKLSRKQDAMSVIAHKKWKSSKRTQKKQPSRSLIEKRKGNDVTEEVQGFESLKQTLPIELTEHRRLKVLSKTNFGGRQGSIRVFKCLSEEPPLRRTLQGKKQQFKKFWTVNYHLYQ